MCVSQANASAPITGSNTYLPTTRLSPVSASTTKQLALNQWANRSIPLKRRILTPDQPDSMRMRPRTM